MRLHYFALRVAGTAAGALLTLSSLAGAAEFRIETKVFMAGQKKAISENTTLFKDGVVYDYIVQPNEVTIFDPDRRKRFVLLDLDRKLRTSIPTEMVEGYIQRVRQLMQAPQAGPMQKFYQNPRFEVAVDEETKELVCDSTYLTYRITTTEADNAEVLHDYIHFANSYAKLNTVTKPGSPPPFPRMAVNDELERRNLIPVKLQFTARNPQPLAGQKSVTLESVHTVDWKLYADDRRRIDETQQQLVAFKDVTPEDYLQLPAQGANQAQRPGKAKAR